MTSVGSIPTRFRQNAKAHLGGAGISSVSPEGWPLRDRDIRPG